MTIKEFKIQYLSGVLNNNDLMNIAKNPKTSKKILELLSKDKDKYVRLYVFKNPNTPKEVLEILNKDKDKYKYVRLYISNNPKTSKKMLTMLES